jgi:membrane protein implicated in regulation of membrane protease activity
MLDFLNDYNALEKFFFACATVGGIFFFVRLVIQFMGIDHGVDSGVDSGADSGADSGGDIGHDFEHHADSDTGFRILTLQGMTSFFMMFGLVGLALYRQSRMGSLISVIGAGAAGLATVWVIDRLFKGARKLQSSGTLDNESAIGGEGKVYVTIPKDGTGSVLVDFKNHHREFDAVSKDKQEIRTGERVKVVWVDGRVLVVEKL